MKSKRRIGMLLTVALLLLVPLLAMQFTAEVNWTFFDFLIAAILLLGTALLCELVMRKVRKPEHRIAICAVLLVAFLLIWIELAVGIFGTPFAGT
jgi:peptidoglycan/LPS O-acetylase OafA/YrhL